MYSTQMVDVTLLIGVQEFADRTLVPQCELRKPHVLNIVNYSTHSAGCSGTKKTPNLGGEVRGFLYYLPILI